MRWLIILLHVFFSTLVTAQVNPTTTTAIKEVVPEVGKHVGGNMKAMTMIVALLMVLLIIVACAFILKRLQPKGFEQKGLKIVSSIQLGSKERLVVVQIGDKQKLLGVTPHQITLLDTLESPLEISPPIVTELSHSIISLVKKTCYQ